ncbi:unnamed protein product [Rotaria sordida]|uniref:Uncharacterized protein n=1 Tax=Rotaria sordida TaxID=392033 RepID=A0A819NDM5_9BILA|nr:unnamed protein product [Rotaria sordida]CAF0940206.1 unnamed protein product [Rotaria sordida]CAF0952124.1 unnamed protein product [Rotaria sordida]CAF0955580.1 unnamed protein product [Rotaria sordida]CAF1110510.1 unnamed protein product [Rotaria sordida]
MPSKRRRTAMRGRRRKQTQESPSQYIYLPILYERSIQKSDSDIRTIPDHTFGKVYSNQIVSHNQTIEERPSPTSSYMIESEIIVSSIQKSRKIKSIKKKENNRKFS